MIYNLVLACVSIIGVLIAYAILKVKLTSPLSLHVSSWFIVLSVGGLVYEDFEPLSKNSFYAFLLWYLIIFYILSIGEIVQSKKVYNTLRNEKYFYTCSRYWLLVIPACVITAYEIYLVGSSGPVNFLLNLRLANIVDDYPGTTFTIMPALYPLIMSMFLVMCIVKNNKLNKSVIWVWVFLYCLGTMGKYAVLIPVLAYLVIREHYYGINKKNVILLAPVLLFVILGLHFVRMSEDDSTTIMNILGTYVYSPLVALSKITENTEYGNAFGAYTFRFVYAIMYKLGLSTTEPVNVILDYVYVPSPTNVYTALQPFFEDFSFPGVVFSAMAYGCFFAFLYGSARNGSIYCLLLYAMFSISIFTSFLTETLVTNFAGNAKLAICLYLIWWLTVKCIKRK